jgi:hypothetical protein
MIKNDYDKLKPAREDYRDINVATEDAFTWDDAIKQTGPIGLYGVEFTSAQNLDLKKVEPEKFLLLHQLDDAARVDAEQQPGFNFYFADEVPVHGLARSFCLWDTREDAMVASQRDAHQNAVRYTFGEGKDVYARYGIKKFKLERTPKGLAFTTLSEIVVSYGKVVKHWQRPDDSPPGN